MRAILMFHNCEGQSHETVSTDHNFWRERRAEADSNRGPSAYQPNALPLGQTGSQSQHNGIHSNYPPPPPPRSPHSPLCLVTPNPWSETAAAGCLPVRSTVSLGNHRRRHTPSSRTKPSWGRAAQTSRHAVGTSPLRSSRKFKNKNGRVHQTSCQRKTERQQCHLPRKEDPHQSNPVATRWEGRAPPLDRWQQVVVMSETTNGPQPTHWL